MRRSKILTGLLAGTIAFATAAPAQADIKGKITTGSEKVTTSWTGVGSGQLGAQTVTDEVGCQPIIHECWDVLVEVTEDGTLQFGTTSTDPKAPDTDLQIFESDAEGNVDIKSPLAESAAADPTPDEFAASSVKAGRFYVLRIDYTIATFGEVLGTMTFKPKPTPTS